MRIPIKYLANLFTVGNEEPIRLALRRLVALRGYMRSLRVDKARNLDILEQARMSEPMAQEMHRLLGIAKFNERFVVPTVKRELTENVYRLARGNRTCFTGVRAMIEKIEIFDDVTFDMIGETDSGYPENDIFKALSVLLQFPDEELLGHVPQLQDVVETFYDANARAACNDFLAYLGSTPVLRLQETYTTTFDLNPQTCLNLSYHKCGNSQERGYALVKLNQLYNSVGLEISGGHLPDYLPLMLEFVYQYPLEGKNQLLKLYYRRNRDLGQATASPTESLRSIAGVSFRLS